MVYYSLFFSSSLDRRWISDKGPSLRWNYHDRRLNRNSPNFTPVRRDFDFRLAFIDFGASVKFSTDDHHVPCASISPPPPFLSPEQAEGIEKDGATFDLFAADVYGLGQILIYEVSGSNTFSRIHYFAGLRHFASTRIQCTALRDDHSRTYSPSVCCRRLETSSRNDGNHLVLAFYSNVSCLSWYSCKKTIEIIDCHFYSFWSRRSADVPTPQHLQESITD